MAGRPRRSAAASVKSYAIPALDELESDSDSDKVNEDQPEASTSNSPAKGKGKAKATPKGKGKAAGKGKKAKSSSDSGSDFADELAKQADSKSSSEDEDFQDEVDEDDDDGEAPNDDSDGSDLVIGPTKKRAMTTSAGRVGGRQAKTLGGRVKQGPATPATIKKGQIQPNQPDDSIYSRVTAPPSPYQSTSDPDTSAFGPLFEPPGWTVNPDTGAVETSLALDERQRSLWLQAWADQPFFVREKWMVDLGWRKGKWSIENRDQNATWGGWYDSPRRQPIQAIDPEAVSAFLPRNIYPSRPSRIFSDEPPRGPSSTQDGDLDSEMELDEGEDDDDDVTEARVLMGGLEEGTEQEEVVLQRFESTRLDSHVPGKPGHMFNAGGPVTGLAWCPRRSGQHDAEYLAVATLSAPLTVRHAPQPMPASIQVWSVDTSVKTDYDRATSEDVKGTGMQREFSLCHDSGEAIELGWCPRGGQQGEPGDNLGILAGVFSDGSVSLFEVPLPSSVHQVTGTPGGFIYAEPVLKLALEHTSCLCFSWASHETIAAGCSDGSVAVWSIGEALRTGATFVRPTHLLRPHQAAIRAIAFIFAPPGSVTLDASVDPDAEPESFVTTGHDGAIRLTDLRDGASPNLLIQERGSGVAATFSAQTGTAIINDTENGVRAWSLKPASIGSSKIVSQHRGAIWNVAASDFHPFAATASADGCCTIANISRACRQKSHRVKFAQKMFKLDFNRRTGQFRMLDNLLPEQRSTLEVVKAKKKGVAPKLKGKQQAQGGPGFENNYITGAWSPEVGVLRVAWGAGMEQARMLASGMACGLVRVDIVDKGPY